MIKPQAPKGFRDFLSADARARQFVAGKIREVFERFGFSPLETPTLEYASVIMGKYGEEADKLVFRFTDRGDRELALRYDQTVPTARVLVEYADRLPRFWRRYQIQNVFRADKPQKGRFREFTQCDIDIFGTTSPVADAEILACTYFAYKNVGFTNVVLPINDRQILFDNLKPFENATVTVLSLIQTIDKLQKIGDDGVVAELMRKGLAPDDAKKALETIRSAKPTESLQKIIDTAGKLGVPKEALTFFPSLARGLDYYTGMIFEPIVPEYKAGALGGGGRYDNLIAQLGGNPTPAVGIAFGFDRMVEAAGELGLIPKGNATSLVLVTIFDESSLPTSLTIAAKLREKGIATELFPQADKLDKQLKFADRISVPYVIIAGPEEIQKNVVKLKNMATKEQEEMTIDQVIKKLSSQT